MAGFQQFIQGGATDRSGSARQADTMRASAETQAASMEASSIVMEAEGTAQFMADANKIVRTGATQYAKGEYLTGETDLGAGDINNLERIQQAHANGKITTDQANLLKRKLGVQVIKHNPLADPNQISADVFGQGAFKQTAAEKEAISRGKEQRKQVDEMLKKYNMLNPYDTDVEKQSKMEGALRMESVKATANTLETEFGKTGAMVLPDGTVRDAYAFGSQYYSEIENQLLQVVSQGGDPDQINIALDSVINQAKQKFSSDSRQLNRFDNGRTFVTSQLGMLDDLRTQFSDDLLTGKLSKEQAANRVTVAKSSLELQDIQMELAFRSKHPGATEALLVINKLNDAVKGNPFLQMQTQGEVGKLTSKVVSSITTGKTGYGDIPGLDYPETPSVTNAALKLDFTKMEELEKKGQGAVLSNALKGMNKEATVGKESEVSPQDWLLAFEGIATGRYGTDGGVRETAGVLMAEGARKDFLPKAFTALKGDLRKKGVDVEDVMKPENFEVQPNGQIKLVNVPDNVRAVVSTSQPFGSLNKYTTAYKALDMDVDLIRHSLVSNPAFGIQPEVPTGEAAAKIAKKVAPVAKAAVDIAQEPQRVMRKGLADVPKFLIDLGTTKGNRVSNLAKSLDKTEDEILEFLGAFGEEFRQEFEKEEK